jgi:hypothetical protein
MVPSSLKNNVHCDVTECCLGYESPLGARLLPSTFLVSCNTKIKYLLSIYTNTYTIHTLYADYFFACPQCAFRFAVG